MSRLSEIYPTHPGSKTDGPSMEAAQTIAPTAKALRADVLRAIASKPAGITADGVADLLGRSILSVRPRVSELRRLGEIRPSGARGKNDSGMSATVWIASPSITGEGSDHA